MAEKEALLTVEAHPGTGRTERWRMSDGSIQRITIQEGRRPEVEVERPPRE